MSWLLISFFLKTVYSNFRSCQIILKVAEKLKSLKSTARRFRYLTGLKKQNNSKIVLHCLTWFNFKFVYVYYFITQKTKMKHKICI